ncbi:14815_t:CDS:1, partial [Gigaspora margarita]
KKEACNQQYAAKKATEYQNLKKEIEALKEKIEALKEENSLLKTLLKQFEAFYKAQLEYFQNLN